MWFGRASQIHKTRFSTRFRNNPILEYTLHTWRRSTKYAPFHEMSKYEYYHSFLRRR